MTFQLVLQWSVVDIEFERLIEIEDALIAGLGNVHDVDGHDIGSGQCNIFILTDYWSAALESATVLLKALGAWNGIAVGYRDIGQNKFVSLWPENQITFSVA